MSITDLGNGSWIIGILLILFGLIGLINAFAAFMMWAKAFLNWLNKKVKSYFWFWLIIIGITLGWYALFKIITML